MGRGQRTDLQSFMEALFGGDLISAEPFVVGRLNEGGQTVRDVEAQASWRGGARIPVDDRIRPALEAGIGAVYVPHERTWHLEKEPVDGNQRRLLVVENFAGLSEHF